MQEKKVKKNQSNIITKYNNDTKKTIAAQNMPRLFDFLLLKPYSSSSNVSGPSKSTEKLMPCCVSGVA